MRVRMGVGEGSNTITMINKRRNRRPTINRRRPSTGPSHSPPRARFSTSEAWFTPADFRVIHHCQSLIF